MSRSGNGLPKDMSASAVIEKHDKHVARIEAEESYSSAEAKAKAENDEEALQWLRNNKHVFWR